MIETILPSSLLTFAEDSYFDTFEHAHHNVALRLGIVKTIYKVEDEKNVDKDTIQYDVLCFQQDKDKGITPIIYKNCITIDSFGGIGDFFEFIKTKPTNGEDKLKAEDGSYVLLLCIDGTSSRGIIIGSVPHHNRKSTLLKAKDKHMEGEYNGLRFKINDDGELTITFKGKTDNKGKPKTPKSGGSQIKMEKDGSVEINDRDLDPELAAGNNKEAKAEGEKPKPEYEKIRIDKTKQSIDIISRKDQNQKTDKNYNLTVKENTNHKTKDLVVQAEGKASYTVKGVFNIKADGAYSLTAANVQVKSDNAIQMQANNVQIQASQVSVGAGGTPAVISSTMYITYVLGIPFPSYAVGPYSSTVTIAP